MSDQDPSRPFEEASADLCSYAGREYLLYSDPLSGWTQVGEYIRDAMTCNTIKILRSRFLQLGVPVRLRTDGGP